MYLFVNNNFIQLSLKIVRLSIAWSMCWSCAVKPAFLFVSWFSLNQRAGMLIQLISSILYRQ